MGFGLAGGGGAALSITPTWPIATIVFVVGMAAGAYIDHEVMQGRIDRTAAEHAGELRQREMQRAQDEARARNNERQMAEAVALAEQEKTDAIARTRITADALIARLRNQAPRQSTCPGGVPPATSVGQGAVGGIVPDRSGEGVVRLAERAEVIRTALAACYGIYDSVSTSR